MSRHYSLKKAPQRKLKGFYILIKWSCLPKLFLTYASTGIVTLSLSQVIKIAPLLFSFETI